MGILGLNIGFVRHERSVSGVSGPTGTRGVDRRAQAVGEPSLGMVIADLHVHTTNSDGTLTLETLPAAAERAGVEAVAVTDHDRMHPDLDGPVTTIDGLEVVHGIELRVETDGERLDLLGYGVTRTDGLSELVADLQENRIERARKIVGCVEDRLGVDLDVPFEPGVGRPHIARAIDESDHRYDYGDAFEHLIGGGCPCYVARDIPSFEEGLEQLNAACDLVGLAHPFRYDRPGEALELTEHLDAVEVAYPYGDDVDTGPAAQAATRHDLLVTGGSDAHETTLGITGLDRDGYDRVRARLG
jgi:predicted metal-dependent phosphoesterase TrpH